ncbi:8432_t:CDS:1, partial [Racocetra fulgida]
NSEDLFEIRFCVILDPLIDTVVNLNQQDPASLDKQIITNLEMLNQENLNQQVTNLDQQAINQQIDKN